MGGFRSMEILQSLQRGRFASIAAARASRTAGELQWRPAQSGSIARDDRRTAWHTGHVNALLSDGNTVVAGTQTGGVWVINPIPDPSFRDGYRATPLSDSWSNTDVVSLSWGPEGTRYVFAGGDETDSLFLIELEMVTGALLPKRSGLAVPLPARTRVEAIVVFEELTRIVIGTTHGLFWSGMPAETIDVTSYQWNEAVGLPDGPCISMARGPGTSLAVSITDTPPPDNAPRKRPQLPDRLFRGDWVEGTLHFEETAVPEAVKSDSFTFVLASSHQARERMYGVAAKNDQSISCVLRSDDGGRTWTEVTVPEGAGLQGAYNRALAVSPYRPDVLAVGWQAPGPFLSTDGGGSWTLLSGGDGTDANGEPCRGSGPAGLHEDLHDLLFPLNAEETDQLLIASDGGVVGTRDLGRCFDSEYNRNLHVLQFYGPPKAPTLSVSSRFHGLLAGGTQDTGNITLHPDADAGPVWHTLVGGDGGVTRFVDPIAGLLHESDHEPRIRLTTWDPAAGQFRGAGVVVRWENARAPRPGLATKVFEAVVAPNWGRAGRLMYACAGTAGGDVFGFLAEPDASNATFRRLANVDAPITAVASLFGAEVLAGCADGRILLVDSATGRWSEQPVEVAGRPIHRLEMLSTDHGYALRAGELCRFDGRSWTLLPPSGQTWKTFTVDRETGRLFAASAADVFSSSDGGRTWLDASLGLPASPHCTDLRIGADAGGGSTLYLSTYGRSVWKAKITFALEGPNFELPPQQLEVLLGVIEDGGGLVRIGGRLVRIKPRQPVSEILAALAKEELKR